MQSPKTVEPHLKEACLLTGSAWAALAEREGGRWIIRAAHRLSKPRQTALSKLLAEQEVDAWLCGALNGEHSRSAALPPSTKLEAPRLYAFPVPQTSQVILAAAKSQSANAQRIWNLLAGLLPVEHPEPSSAENFLPSLQTELAYEMAPALDRVLAAFVGEVSPQGAWLAIRRGETLDILAQWNDPRGAGLSLPIDASGLLRKLSRTLADVSSRKGEKEWDEIPHLARKTNTRTWICLPLVIGQRLIGAVALWAHTDLDLEEWQRLRALAARVAPSVEVIVTFNELTEHLRRLAMLNDFALTVSSAQNLDQIARRVFGLLSRAFGTEMVALYLPSIDRRVLRAYRSREGKFGAHSTALEGHPIASFLDQGRIHRYGDAAADGFPAIHPEARSALVVPLKYRGQSIGILLLESPRPDAFTRVDEHLMVVIASHLAGLVEYGRLREEAEARARNLGLIHEVVQQVVGLTKKHEVAQITADLLAQYFAYELAGVLLLDSEHKPTIVGLGGTRSESIRRTLHSEEYGNHAGITGYVLSTGESVLVNDASQSRLYKALPGWDALSEMCVALKDGDRVLGIIDVESSQRNAFAQTDLLAIESLAGVLATVVSSADQYQRLQETVRQLRVAQVELRARMEAQQEAESRLVQAAKLAAVGEMSAGIAHELNNPLTTVTGFTELVLDEMPQNAPHRADLEMVIREARRARDVVRRLLDFARQGERTRTRADMNEIVEEVLALSRHLIHTSGVDAEISLEKSLPWVSVDRNQMKQVLLNLVHNALQAMPSGGVLQLQSARRRRNGREWVTVSVRDSGLGIGPEHKSRIFEPFFTTKGDAGGTGLGLSVTYGIITDHGGTIDVDSQVGSGSAFTVWLPL